MVHIRTNIREQISKLAADVLADSVEHREFLSPRLDSTLKVLAAAKLGAR